MLGIDESGTLRDPERCSEEFHGTPLGRLPKQWEIRRLSNWVRPDAPITYGIVQAGPHIPDGVPYIRTGDMAGDSIQLKNLQRTSKRIAKVYKRSEVRHGEIVFAIRATVGKVLPVPLEVDGANLTQGTARIAPGPEVCGQYLLWALRSDAVQRQVRRVQKGTTFSEITLGQLKLLQVACPRSLNEQKAIAEVLDALETRLKAEQDQVSKLRQIRQGLMDDLLTGHVRVPLLGEGTK